MPSSLSNIYACKHILLGSLRYNAYYFAIFATVSEKICFVMLNIVMIQTKMHNPCYDLCYSQLGLYVKNTQDTQWFLTLKYLAHMS